MNLIKALCRIVADFKSVEKKFEDQGYEKEKIKKYLDLFKSLRDAHKLKDKEKDIDTWGKKDFKEFEEFVDEKSGEKKHIRQLKEMEGAELIVENEDWFVYLITSPEASKRYGDGSKWCITQPQWWKKYQRRMTFYFLISKKLDPSDKWFKIAVQLPKKGEPAYWDAQDASHKELPKNLNVPEFEMKPKETSAVDLPKLEQIAQEIEDAYASAEEYYGTVEAYESYGDYLTVDNMERDWKRHLDSSAEELVEELETLFEDEDKVKGIVLDCSEISLEGMYYASNEVCSIGVGGDQEYSLDEELAADIEELTDDEKEELKELITGVSISNDFEHFYVGSDYTRLALILDETTLENYIEAEKERRRIAGLDEDQVDDLHMALESKHSNVVLESLEKVKDKKSLIKVAETNTDEKVKVKALDRLGDLFKDDSDVQTFLQETVNDKAQKNKVRETAVKYVTDQKFLKEAVLSKDDDKPYSLGRNALLSIQDKEFIKACGLKERSLTTTALELIDDLEYAKQMLKIKDPPYEAIIRKLPASEQRIFRTLALRPMKGTWYDDGKYQKLAISKITSQKVLFDLFFSLRLDKKLKGAVLETMDLATLKKAYTKLTPKQYKEYGSEFRELADGDDSLLKSLALRELKLKNNYSIAYHLGDILDKIKDEKWVIKLLKRIKPPKVRNDVIEWMQRKVNLNDDKSK